ncbi:retrovirus-related pol polyprotein from transposon TNT 1-94 [Tanacetum coccineum]
MSLIISKERHIKESIWYMNSGYTRSMTGVKSYLHKYVEQPGPKAVFGNNSSCITEGYGSINCVGNVFTKVAFINGLKYNLISISQLYDAKYNVQFDDKQGIIFNAIKEIILIAPRRNDVYVLDMMVENQNIVKVKQIRNDNGTEFRNHELENFCDEKGISQIASPYTPEQNDQSLSKDMIRLPVRYSEKESLMLAIFDHLGKFNAKADDGYFLGYSFVSKSFRVFNTIRQQVEETYHVTFNESMEAIRFTNTSVDEIGIDDSSRYHPNEFIHEDDPSRQYQENSDISYYVIPHGHSHSEITQEKHVPKVIAPNKPDIPLTKDTEGHHDLINAEGTHEQNVHNEQIITQPTEGPSRNPEVLVFISKSLVPDVPQLIISNQASTSMLTRSMATKLTAALASECLFADFLFEIEPKKVSGALKHPGRVNPPGFESSEFPDYVCKLDKALYGLKQAPRACLMGEITYFLGLQIKQDDKEISICQEHTRNLLKKYEIFDSSSVKTHMVPANNLGPDLAG